MTPFLHAIDFSRLLSPWAYSLLYLVSCPYIWFHIIILSSTTLFISFYTSVFLRHLLARTSERRVFGKHLATSIPFIPSSCATESWNATPHAGVSTTNTTLTCAPHTALVATTHKSGPSTLVTPAVGTLPVDKAIPHPWRAVASSPTLATRAEIQVATPVDLADETSCLR